MKLTTSSKYEFFQYVIRVINKPIEEIKNNSDIEIIFDNNPKYTLYDLQNDKLYFKNILPTLIDLLGPQDGVYTFLSKLAKALHEILSKNPNIFELEEQFNHFNKYLFGELFDPENNLSAPALLFLHKDTLINLDRKTLKIVSYRTNIGVSTNISFYFREGIDLESQSIIEILNNALTIKNGLIHHDANYSNYFQSTYNENELKEFRNLSLKNSVFINSLSDKNNDLNSLVFSKSDIITSTIDTLLNKFKDNFDTEADEDQAFKEFQNHMNTFFDTFTKGGTRNKYYLTDLLTILSIFYLRVLYIDSQTDEGNRNSVGRNYYFSLVYHEQYFNRIKKRTAKYEDFQNTSKDKELINSHFKLLHHDIDELTDKHLLISKYNENSTYDKVNLCDSSIKSFSNSFIHKLFYMDQSPLFDVLINTLMDINNHVCDNIDFFVSKAPSELINLSNKLIGTTRDWSYNIALTECQKSGDLSKFTYNKNNFKLESHMNASDKTHISLSSKLQFIESLHFKKRYLNKK